MPHHCAVRLRREQFQQLVVKELSAHLLTEYDPEHDIIHKLDVHSCLMPNLRQMHTVSIDLSKISGISLFSSSIPAFSRRPYSGTTPGGLQSVHKADVACVVTDIF